MIATPTANIERERLLLLGEEYRERGYEVSFHPNVEDLPDFLKSYRPDLIVRLGKESVVIVVKSRSSLNSSSTQYLRNLAQAVAENAGWRFELVMTNPEDAFYFPKAEGSLQEDEIESGLQVARQLVAQHLESAMLYSWSLVEATLRIIAEKEELSLQKLEPLYLVKKLAIEGIISRSQYLLLMNSLSLRNAIAHGFKTTQITQTSVGELIEIAEQLLKSLHSGEATA
jgi:REase_AHJR-like